MIYYRLTNNQRGRVLAHDLIQDQSGKYYPAERREQNMYATMVERPSDKKFLVQMLDESSQIRDNRKLAKRIKTLIDEFGVPRVPQQA